MDHFHHFSISNRNQSISIALPFGQKWLTFITFQSPIKINQCLWAKYQGYSVTFRPEMAHFHHFSISNQNQSMSILVLVGQNTKAIALLFCQKWLIFITCEYPIKINQCQFWSMWVKIQRL